MTRERLALEALYEEIDEGKGLDCRKTYALSFLDQIARGLRDSDERETLEEIYNALWDCQQCTRDAINRYETIIKYGLGMSAHSMV